jgi:hypothetical protein
MWASTCTAPVGDRADEPGRRAAVDGEDRQRRAGVGGGDRGGGPKPEGGGESDYGWYWAADVLEKCGAELHLAHPLGMKGITAHRRVKNDVKDAVLLADLLRLGSLPEAYIAPRGLRELRELVRFRAKLVTLRANLKSQAHAVMAKEGVLPTRTDMFGLGGQAQLDEMHLGDCYRIRIDSLRDLIDAFTEEIEAPELYLDASGHEPNAGGHRTNHPNRVGLAADTALTRPAPSGMP